MKLGFVGSGNMAGGLARGWAAARGEPGSPEVMLFADADPERARALAEEVGGQAIEGNRALAEASDLVVLAVKPNVLDQVAEEVTTAGTPVISILAGTRLERLARALPGIELVRVMPNHGAQLREAVLCVAYPDQIEEGHRRRISELLGLIGEVVELDEEMIDTATIFMSCSPGYLALIAEIMVDAAVKEGLSEEDARRMIARSISATGGLLNLHAPRALKEAVASPGGVTEAGLKALERSGIRETVEAGIDASLAKVRG